MRQCVIVRRSDSELIASHLLERSGFWIDELDGDKLDDRDVLSLLEQAPFAIILPLSLPHYLSVRIAELIAMSRSRIRLILVSGTDAPTSVLEELFDRHLPRCGNALIAALRRPRWTHAFERRRCPLDHAIQKVLQQAACFWIGGGGHAESFPSLMDYQRQVATSARHFNLLFLASDPTDAARLRLMKEFSEVEHELAKRSDYSFTLKQVFSSRPDELTRRLLEDKPHIVHFSGHGDPSGRLCFEDAGGRSWPADKAAVAQMFEPAGRYVKCVVLNACFSAEQAQLIGAHVDYAFGLASAVSDEAALGFAKGFYGALSATGKVPRALDAARANLRLLACDAATLQCAGRTANCAGHGVSRFRSALRGDRIVDGLPQRSSRRRLSVRPAGAPQRGWCSVVVPA